MSKLTGYIEGIGLIGPGLTDWPHAIRVLTGELGYGNQATVIPAPTALPAAERRRCGAIVKLSLAVGYQAAAHAGADVAALSTVFAASGGDGVNCHEICQMLASDDRQISPTRFHNSVHNAAAGYWGIATGAMAPSSVLCAYDGSFGAGLLEALACVAADSSPTLLIACDTPYPEPLRTTRPIPNEFGVALVLALQQTERSQARIDISLVAGTATPMADAALEELRKAIPAARSLPMLQAMAAREKARLVLDYLDSSLLAVELSPCA
jgi:hypothetical protein